MPKIHISATFNKDFIKLICIYKEHYFWAALGFSVNTNVKIGIDNIENGNLN